MIDDCVLAPGAKIIYWLWRLTKCLHRIHYPNHAALNARDLIPCSMQGARAIIAPWGEYWVQKAYRVTIGTSSLRWESGACIWAPLRLLSRISLRCTPHFSYPARRKLLSTSPLMSVKQYKTVGEELWKQVPDKVVRSRSQNAELFTLTYGALVVQLIKDYENYVEVNMQLERMCVLG